jgi:hypothetical protein
MLFVSRPILRRLDRLVPVVEFSTIHANCPTGESVWPYPPRQTHMVMD